MLAIQLLREKKDWVIARLSVKHFTQTHLIDEILQLDEQRRQWITEHDQLQNLRNTASREIGQLMKAGNHAEAAQKKQQVAEWNEKINALKNQLDEIEQKIQQLLLQLPNLPHESVPAGESAADNVIIRQGGSWPTLPENALPHWELASRYDLIHFDTGTRLTGSGFPVFKGAAARLERALIQYFLDYNTRAGYVEYLPPLLVNAQTAFGTGQLPDKEGQMYFIPEDQFYLIPTAEVPLTNIYRDSILQPEQLPIKMTAYTPCFRREAGSYGKDVRGLNRVHQFDKVEIVQLVHPDQSYQSLDEMVAHVEGLIQSLELPYRIVKLCGADMSFTSALTYDFEVYSAAQQRWLEVSSVSNFETFQTLRMKIRFRDGKQTRLVHSLNGSSLALPRILAALLENNQQADGIHLPAILHPYTGFTRIG
ncbi:serine--tRNA ligase [Thermoflavifilum thermophilum]|uniref:Serine--tRNA ligase n=1 Tax=Thermoflavifilum thermophilum TaxID=1393122 RepID=A0A1I7N6P9_9BACT|nr:serine--tRNA ligase [Thermoflavifilum thermophilum]SFV30342.1 seryl-tRNA synthetase [Thermoflavifilum thermophilum]